MDIPNRIDRLNKLFREYAESDDFECDLDDTNTIVVDAIRKLVSQTINRIEQKSGYKLIDREQEVVSIVIEKYVIDYITNITGFTN